MAITETDRSPKISIGIQPTHLSGDDKPAITKMGLYVHHVILHSFDPSNDLFECSQKLTAYGGYMNRKSREFTRPEDHCYEVEEVFVEDSDCTISVCKTDGDHMLGYKFNNVFSLWKCNHQVNTWFHYTRDRANSWLHPYYNLKYGSSNDPSRIQPPYFDSLPATLTPTLTPTNYFTWEESFGKLVQYKTREGHSTNFFHFDITTTTIRTKENKIKGELIVL